MRLKRHSISNRINNNFVHFQFQCEIVVTPTHHDILLLIRCLQCLSIKLRMVRCDRKRKKEQKFMQIIW